MEAIGVGRIHRAAGPGGSWDGVPMESPIAGLAGDGPYKPTWDSLLQYEAPEWYRDAKFAHLGALEPAVRCGGQGTGTRARCISKGSGQNKYQLAHYGPSSKFGYKDLCAQWTLLNWEPEELIARYKKAGARMFISLANHHDGFDSWDSKHHPWNSANIGPHRDVVGEWAAAARAQGMRFGVTVHQARNWWWFQTVARRGQDGAAGGRAVRRPADPGGWQERSGGRGWIRSGCMGRSIPRMRFRTSRM